MKRITTAILCFLLSVCTCVGLAACGTQEEKPAPTPNPSGTLSAEDAYDEYREQADDKISEILSSENMTIPDDATAYYLSNDGDDNADGSTPETAWKTLNKLNSISLSEGSYVCFERGGLWRGYVNANKGVTYTAYGDVADGKPCIYGSPVNGANANKWVKTDTENVWRYVDAFDKDVGMLVFDEGEAYGEKEFVSLANGVYFNETRFPRDDKGNKSSVGVTAWEGLGELKKDLDFWHNNVSFDKTTADNFVYLYSETNPGERFFSIEFSIKQHLMNVSCEDVTVDNICFKYTGAHGVSAIGPVNLTIQNCEFGWIGGSLQNIQPVNSLRFGNAVQVWMSCDGFYVKNNYIYQVYDAAITPQGNTNQAAYFVEKDIEFSENVIEYSNYGMEFFVTAGVDNDSHFENIKVSKNHIWYSGFGIGEQRPDKCDTGAINFWRGTWKSQMTEKAQISDNVIGISRLFLINTQYGACDGNYKDTTGFIYTGNVIIDHTSPADPVNNTAIGWGGYDFLNKGKKFCVIREWIDGDDRWKTYYDELQFYNEDFVDFFNGFTEGGKDNVCYFLPEE